MPKLPGLFVSHGAPTLAITASPARDFLAGLGGRLPRPRAILVASAHWETAAPSVSSPRVNDTIHDFRGFPRELYDMRYAAPGSAELAERTAALLRAGGVEVTIDRSRGLDHGAWIPLLLAYPAADIPVAQLSLQPTLGPPHHLRLGRLLEPLRSEGVLVLGSGSFTHNLAGLRGGEEEPPWVTGFAEWLDRALMERRTDDLLAYRDLAPEARRNHPTDEHLLPLYVALGSAGAGWRAERWHSSATFGALRMDAYAFEGDTE
jgi:4,5-DOPA dioxygenase extradiol